jgi:hypothetical protein
LALRAVDWPLARIRLISLWGGSLIVVLWTVLRHITNGINFDVVGQIGLADQWARGFHTSAELGVTNYVLKLPLYALINTLHFISPMHRILFAALVCNVATYLLLCLIINKILDLYAVKDRTWLYLAMVWLATIAGSVFWVDYANSRNLETVGGIVFLYLILKYLKTLQRSVLGGAVIIGSFIFFADTLQIYVFGAGALLYVFVRLVIRRSRMHLKQALLVGGTVAGAFIGSKLLFVLVKLVLPVSFLSLPSSKPAFNVSTIIHTLTGVLQSSLQVFGADPFKHPIGLNSIRELLNMVIVLGLFIFITKLLLARRPQNFPSGLLAAAVIANIAIYAFSGQSLQHDTSRYLVMLPIISVVFIGLSGHSLDRKHQAVQRAWLVVILLSTVLVVGALGISWPQRHAKDQHIYQTVSYLQHSGFTYAIGSRETGVTSTYFAQGGTIVLPLGCADHRLIKDNLFYDIGAFDRLNAYTGEVPIILQDNAIRFGANNCALSDIVRQFGLPKREQLIPGVGTAEIYDSIKIKNIK